jgi:hypothetical protein
MEFIKKSALELTPVEIGILLGAWSVQEWKMMTVGQFQEKFINSDFYLLKETDEIVALLRVNNSFTFRVGERTVNIPELVGLVSLVQKKGYGKIILEKLKIDLMQNNKECVGFCFSYNRGFYEKCGIEVLPGVAKYFKERDGEAWRDAEDDDVINVYLSEINREMILGLNAGNNAYLIEVEGKDEMVCKV